MPLVIPKPILAERQIHPPRCTPPHANRHLSRKDPVRSACDTSPAEQTFQHSEAQARLPPWGCACIPSFHRHQRKPREKTLSPAPRPSEVAYRSVFWSSQTGALSPAPRSEATVFPAFPVVKPDVAFIAILRNIRFRNHISAHIPIRRSGKARRKLISLKIAHIQPAHTIFLPLLNDRPPDVLRPYPSIPAPLWRIYPLPSGNGYGTCIRQADSADWANRHTKVRAPCETSGSGMGMAEINACV